MILRKLAHSIRRQDWLAVAIEFLIVVAGIFVGLQVTDWNERRQLRERELNYLQRMSEDLSKMEAEFHQILEYGGGRSAVVMRALRALEQCDAKLATPDDFRITFAGYQTQPTPTIITRTYEEMVSSGALASMTDRDLSGEIASLFGALGNYKTFVQGVRISLPVVDRVLWKHLDLSYDDEGRPVLRKFDFATACQNRELRNAAWEIRDLMWDWEIATRRAADQLEKFADRLDRHVAAHTGDGAPPVRSGHMGNTFLPLRETQGAVAGAPYSRLFFVPPFVRLSVIAARMPGSPHPVDVDDGLFVAVHPVNCIQCLLQYGRVARH